MKVWLERVGTLVLASVLLLGTVGCGARPSVGSKLTVKVAVATTGSLAATEEIAGAFVPARTAIVSSKLAGQVAEVKAEVGDWVRAGQLLVRIDTKELQAQLEQAEAAVRVVRDQAEQARLGMEVARVNVDTAQIKLEAARKDYERVRSMAEAGIATEKQLDDAKSALDQVQQAYDLALKQYEVAKRQYETASGSALAQAEAAVNSIRVNMSNARITSPISGVVTNRNVQPGEMVSPGAPLLVIADTSTLKLQGTVSQEIAVLLKVGQKVRVTVDVLPGLECSGTVTQVGPMAAATGERFPVEISLANPGNLKAGMTARATLELAAPEGVVVPAAAVRTDSGQSYVFVVKGGVVERRPVTLGLRNEEQVVVLQGLQAGEEVAVSNVGVLQDKMAVSVVGR
jgi:multidrug efflux pump subunit AcrA (membrane-fusion protein)